MRTGKPAPRTAFAMRSSSVATRKRVTTPAFTAADTRSATCRIIGLPSSGKSGLPGKRVDAYRAGMIAVIDTPEPP